jgi:predicted PurR-regulated permease PerM
VVTPAPDPQEPYDDIMLRIAKDIGQKIDKRSKMDRVILYILCALMVVVVAIVALLGGLVVPSQMTQADNLQDQNNRLQSQSDFLQRENDSLQKQIMTAHMNQVESCMEGNFETFVAKVDMPRKCPQ